MARYALVSISVVCFELDWFISFRTLSHVLTAKLQCGVKTQQGGCWCLS